MRVLVDLRKCIGSGMCTTIATDVFKLDDKGKVVVLKGDVIGQEAELVRDSVACCPVDAITIEDEQ